MMRVVERLPPGSTLAALPAPPTVLPRAVKAAAVPVVKPPVTLAPLLELGVRPPMPPAPVAVTVAMVGVSCGKFGARMLMLAVLSFVVDMGLAKGICLI